MTSSLSPTSRHDQSTTASPDAPVPEADSPSLDERLLNATIGALELFGVYLGTRLGLYRALHAADGSTPDELADATGIDGRYAREWLEHQAVAGLLTVDHAAAAPEQRIYRLPSDHVGALVDAVDAAHVAPFADMLVGIAGALDEVVAAYRTGDGVPYASYGEAFRRGQGAINRPAFAADLVSTWIPAAGLHDRLGTAGARVADLGTGHGWSAIAVADAYPEAEVLGLDADPASVSDAAMHAAASGVGVDFHVADGRSLGDYGTFDAILILEALHDLAHPEQVLAACRAALRDGGVVLVADENVAERFTAPGDELERMMYGWSVSHCLPASRVEAGSSALGTVLRASTVEELAGQAGFDIDVLDVDAGFFRLYRLS